MWCVSGRGPRRDVDAGSNPAREGVSRAFKFWVMVSSIELRDNRRNSVGRVR